MIVKTFGGLRQKRCILLVAVGLMFCSCASDAYRTSPPGKSLSGNRWLLVGDIQRAFSSEEWKFYAAREYVGYVILSGDIVGGKVVIRRVSEAYPDGDLVPIARKLGAEISVTAVTIGSRARPTAEVYVVFYDKGIGREALIFARQETIAATSGSDILYVRTTRY